MVGRCAYSSFIEKGSQRLPSCFHSLSLAVPKHCCRKVCLCSCVFCSLSIRFQGSKFCMRGSISLLGVLDTGGENGPGFRFTISL